MPAFDTHTDTAASNWSGYADRPGQFVPDDTITAQEYDNEPQAGPDELDTLNITPEDDEEVVAADERAAPLFGALAIEASEPSGAEEPQQKPTPSSAEADHSDVDEPAANTEPAKVINEAPSDDAPSEPPAAPGGNSGNDEPPEGPPPADTLPPPGEEPEPPDGEDGMGGDPYEWDYPGEGDESSAQSSGAVRDAYHTLHPVGRYVAKDRSAESIDAGQTVSIPTGLVERTGFTKGSGEWVTNQTADEYRGNLFADDIPGATPETTSIAGGEAGAFSAGRIVLDVGAGQAVALLQFAERYPDTTIIGVDQYYNKTREIDLTKPGVQLTKDDWHELARIPSDSVDTILSQRGVVPWGIGPDEPRSGEVADAITRVAKEGAVWRFDSMPENGPLRTYVTTLLQDRGWDVTPVADARGYLRFTVVAIKKERSEQAK
ncbi:MAG TPA: class I SAM-dependent methyltransferase [Candidatus Saccharimonadales bacterium]|jgi:hypothetical protein|nr:class I SAM-dependent methyltransferase [Candidatus Saccharimonadales bacterium]